MKALAILLLLLFAGSAWAQSQEIKKPIPPVIDKTIRDNKPKDSSDSKQAISAKLPPTVDVTVGGNLDLKGNNEHENGNSESPNWAEWLMALFTGVLVFVTAKLAFYTKGLWGSTNTLVSGADQTAKHELRAYLKLSHVSPGLELDNMGGVRVQLRVKNFGKTPARVNDVRMNVLYLPDIASLPIAPPPIDKPEDVMAFLVQEEELFFWHYRVPGDTVVANLKNTVGTLLVWGYVDYTDAFNERHLAGYGRTYNRSKDVREPTQSSESYKDRSNLDLVTKADYNYDRPY